MEQATTCSLLAVLLQTTDCTHAVTQWEGAKEVAKEKAAAAGSAMCAPASYSLGFL